MTGENDRKYTRMMLHSFLKGSLLLFLISMLASAVTALADMIAPQIVRVAVDQVMNGVSAEHLPAFVKHLIEAAGGVEFQPAAPGAGL